jgi:hypothetical protein
MIELGYLGRFQRLSIMMDEADDHSLAEISGPGCLPLDLWDPWVWTGLPHVKACFGQRSKKHADVLALLFPLKSEMRWLEELEIRTGEEDVHSPDFLALALPKLKSLHLNVAVDFGRLGQAIAAALTHLQLSPRASPNEIIEFLFECPNLQYLFLDQEGEGSRYWRGGERVYKYPAHIQPDIRLPYTTLPALLGLRVMGDAALIVAAAINAPRLISLEISADLNYPRGLIQLLRDTSQCHPSLSYVSLEVSNGKWGAPNPPQLTRPHPIEVQTGEHLARFLRDRFRTLEVVVLERNPLLSQTLAYLFMECNSRACNFFGCWRLLHIICLPLDIPVHLNPLPAFSPYLHQVSQTRNPAFTIEFANEDGDFARDELELQANFFPRIRCVRDRSLLMADLQQGDKFADVWTRPKIGWRDGVHEQTGVPIYNGSAWGWEKPMEALRGARCGTRYH